MATTAKSRLLRCLKFAGIERHALSPRMLVCSRVASFTLYPGEDRLQIVADDGCVATETPANVTWLLLPPESGNSVLGSARGVT
jgi:hypothetical protein